MTPLKVRLPVDVMFRLQKRRPGLRGDVAPLGRCTAAAQQRIHACPRNDELKWRRILDVTSLTSREDYYVVEKEDQSGAPVANVAITNSGVIAAAEDTRGLRPALSIELDAAAKNVTRYTNASIRHTKYVYAHSTAEPGSPVFAPLAAVETSAGTIYVNSKAEAFAEEGSSAIAAVDVVPNQNVPPGVMKLKKLRPRQ